jgi:hypothetical protein
MNHVAAEQTTTKVPREATMAPPAVKAVGVPQTMEAYGVLRAMAKDLAASTLVPQQYQGNPSNCLIAMNMAHRIGADPMMVMQNLYIVHGNPGWSAQFLIATFNNNPKFTALRYEFQGKEGTDAWACRAFATEKATGNVIQGAWVSIALAKSEGWYGKNGSKWKTMPQQMLMYRAAAWMIRAYAPEIAMGLQTAEELRDVHDMSVTANGTYAAVDGLNVQIARQAAEEHHAPQEQDTEERQAEGPVLITCPKTESTVRAEVECKGCKDRNGCSAHE